MAKSIGGIIPRLSHSRSFQKSAYFTSARYNDATLLQFRESWPSPSCIAAYSQNYTPY